MASMEVFHQLRAGMIIHLRRKQYFLDKKREREELKAQREGGDYFKGGHWGLWLKIMRIEQPHQGTMIVHCEDRYQNQYPLCSDNLSPSRIELSDRDDFPPVRKMTIDLVGKGPEEAKRKLEDYDKLVAFLDEGFAAIVDRLSGEGCSYAEIATQMILAAANRGTKEEKLLRAIAESDDYDKLDAAQEAVKDWLAVIDEKPKELRLLQ